MAYGTKLPVPMFSRSDFSFWSILKQCIGKELSKITMPVVFNEPLSFIQRLAEYMEYAPLIEKAANCDNPIERMEYVTAFAISALSSNWERIGKPFNPLLGETYELDRPDLGFRFVGEQVSHHPPITAVYAEGKSYILHGSIQPKLKFWGKTVEIIPKGHIYLELLNYKETYSWQNVNCCIHNVIVGSLWVEHYGTMEITCDSSNIKAVVNFRQSGWFAKDLHHVDGYIYDGKKKERALYGSWVLGIYSCPPNEYDKFVSDTEAMAKYRAKDKKDKDKENQKMTLMTYNYQLSGQKTLWLVNPRSPESADYYHFSLFSMTLNELLPGMKEALPPTDSRFRPDIRSMEEGKIDQSAEEKNRVEEKQREARKERKRKSKEWQPRWFTLKKVGGHEEWVFNPTYWQRNWQECADIF
ncbi:Oxysterol-binding protein- protein 1 [Bulinus truncatus]|nr:Oxysterol-binding protein- protein 1 [Bulinus truncatus]